MPAFFAGRVTRSVVILPDVKSKNIIGPLQRCAGAWVQESTPEGVSVF